MIVVIDIGNTSAVLSGIYEDRVLFSESVPTCRSWGRDEYTEALAPILQGVACRGAILSSVVPEITEVMADAAGHYLGRRPMIVGPSTRTGLIIDLPEPDKVGRDRLADAAWAAARAPLPAMTADLGTATTFNVILPGGVFAGGMICAGMGTGLNALADYTSQLPRLRPEHPEELIGRSTRQCMLSGAAAGTAAMIDGLTAMVEAQLGCPVTLLVTGGTARYAVPFLRHEHIYDPDMTRKALALLYELNAD